jgi:hypothetical protein
MTAAATDIGLDHDVWTRHRFTLPITKVAYKGALAALRIGVGTIVPATGASDELVVGRFARYVDATSAAKSVDVDLFREVKIHWMANGTVAVAATDIGSLCYVDDDQTVSMSPKSTGASLAGRVWAYSATLGVGVEILPATPAAGGVFAKAAVFVYTSNDYAVPDYPVSGTAFDVATTGAASTISLPANAREGTELVFCADGTKNGHTVTYRDVATAISAAATASKRHQARAVFLASKWTVILTVGP